MEDEAKANHVRGSRTSTWSHIGREITTDTKPAVGSSTTGSMNQNQKPSLRITDAEKQSRFLRGECFCYGEKYGPGHRCKTGTLKVCEADNEGATLQVDDVTDQPDTDEEVAEISLHAILGKPQPTTMKIHGQMEGTEVLVLIDGGSTHNFISDVLVSEMQLRTDLIPPFGVQIGNGDVIRCNKVCKGLKLKVNDLEIEQEFYPFSLGGADLVLGI